VRLFCKIDGRDGIIVGSGVGYRRVKDRFEPCMKLLVILPGERHLAEVSIQDAEIYGAPRKFRKLHKKLLKRAASVAE
jgi:hypothetical protein